MRIYSHDQSEMFYLSPYNKVLVRNNRLTIYNVVFDSTAELECPETFSRELLEELSKGAKKERLLMFFELFSGGDAKQILDSWIKAGVIE